MPAERYYFPQTFNLDETVVLEGTEFQHLTRVMRARVGEEVELVDGKGTLGKATIQSLGKQNGQLLVTDIKNEPAPSFQVILAQAIPRLNRLDTIVEKGTELGMTQLWLFPADKSERKSLTSHQMNRNHSLAIAAMKQCGRLWLPEISLLPPIQLFNPVHFPSFFGELGEGVRPFGELWEKKRPASGAIFFVGPEGGFTPQEKQAMMRLGAEAVTLHKDILRTDTAPLAALALIAHWRLFH